MKGGRTGRCFWDSSALVPLLCRDSYSAGSRRLLRAFPEIVVWWATPVEIHAAIARLLKGEQLTREGAAKALSGLDQLRLRWREVLPVDRVRDLAEECLERHGVRSADAFQLAAALLWCKETPKGRPFISLDQELSDAARHAGFDVHP